MAVQRRRRQAISAIDKQRIADAFEDPERNYLEMANNAGNSTWYCMVDCASVPTGGWWSDCSQMAVDP